MHSTVATCLLDLGFICDLTLFISSLKLPIGLISLSFTGSLELLSFKEVLTKNLPSLLPREFESDSDPEYELGLLSLDFCYGFLTSFESNASFFLENEKSYWLLI